MFEHRATQKEHLESLKHDRLANMYDVEQKIESAEKIAWEAAYRKLGITDEVRIWRDYESTFGPGSD